MDETLRALLVLNMIEGIGAVRLKSLLRVFPSVDAILRGSREELLMAEGIGENLASRIAGWGELDYEDEIRRAEKVGAKIVPLGDHCYPEWLSQIYDPPLVLYIQGELRPDDKRAVALVGSRRPSYYGRSTAERLGLELGLRGVTVVSGLARGIDTCAHKGALKARARTIAVLGCGLEVTYPRENARLRDEIARNGAVISEFPMQAAPLSEHFPRRNRLISGLVLAVVVVEAARHSGSLITASCALEQGREVCAVPGKACSPGSAGNHFLLRQGAKLVETADDVLEEMPAVDEQVSKRNEESLPAAERKLFCLLGDEPRHIDELMRASAVNVEEALSILAVLEMRGLICQLPGKMFVKK